MPTSNHEQRASAPLISLRRSLQLQIPGRVVLGTGLWLGIGVFALLGPVRPLAGANVGWAYLVATLLALPTALSMLELRSWIGYSGGSYRLIRATERTNLTFFAGWAYLLGWASLSALLVQAFAAHAGKLIAATTNWQIGEPWLVAATLLFFILTNVAGFRAPWRLGVWVAAGVGAGIVVLIGLLAVRLIDQPAVVLAAMPRGNAFFGAVMALAACLWVGELIGETGSRRQRSMIGALVLALAGPLLAAALALTARWAAPGMVTIEDLAAFALPSFGRTAALAAGTLVIGLAWQVIALMMLRRFQFIGLDGWLPDWVLRSYRPVKTPVVLILIQALLTPAALLIGRMFVGIPARTADATLNLAYLAGLVILVLQIGVNVAAIVLAKHQRAANRTLHLPLYPAIPATGIAINLLLLFAAPWPVLLLGAIWLGLGALVYWRSGRERIRSAQLGVTVFQDIERHGNITSAYPVIVPVANPNTALDLVAFGAAIARQHNGHVVAVQVIQVPEQHSLESGRIQAQEQLDLLERVLEKGTQLGIPIEGVTRLSRSVSQGILDTIAEESAHLVVMGWNAREIGVGRRGLGHILDSVLADAPCHVVVVRGSGADSLSRIVVPIANGPHAPLAAELALNLTAQNRGEVTLLHVVRRAGGEVALEQGQELVDGIRDALPEPERVTPLVATASAPLKGILEVLDDQDAILIGASELSFMDSQPFAQLPFRLAQETDKLLVLVRSHTGLGFVARKAWSSVARLLPSLTPEEQVAVYQKMRKAAQPNINYFVLIALSAMIATLGLLLNSPAVIIGAMLVAPLMSPFIAEAIGIVWGDARTTRNGLTSILQGVVASIFIAIVTTLISPLAQATPEVLARTQPNLLDLMVALVSGMAGAYAIARKEVGEALPGVAIAAALMPPLCTVGIGIALGELAIALGALLLFSANLVAIVFASAVVFLLLGIRPPHHPARQRWLRQGLIVSIIALILISLPLGVVMARAVERERVEGQTQTIVEEALADLEGADLTDFNIEVGWRAVRVTGTLYASGDVSSLDVRALDERLEQVLNRSVDVRLFVIQGTTLHSSGTTP